MTFIGFSGKRESGKSYAADHLVNQGFKLVKIADGIKLLYKFWLNDLRLPGTQRIEGDLKESVDHEFAKAWNIKPAIVRDRILMESLLMLELGDYIEKGQSSKLFPSLSAWASEHLTNNLTITPRYVMQRLGSEWGRNTHGEDFLVNMWRRKVAGLTKVVTDDIRFENEAAAVRRKGGYIIGVYGRSHSTDDHSTEIVDVSHDVKIRNTYNAQFLTLIDETVHG